MESASQTLSQVYYDDIVILPGKPYFSGEEGRGKQFTGSYFCQPSTSKEDPSRRQSLCCDSCRLPGEYSGDDSEDEPQPSNRTFYDCPHCGSSFTLSIALKYHIKGHHEQEKFFRCSYCDFSSDDLPVVRRHVREVHWLEKRHHCPYCKYRAKRSTHLRRHVEARHGPDRLLQKIQGDVEPRVQPEPKSLFCDQCEFATNLPRSLKRHMKNCHGNSLSLRCSQCEFTAGQSRELRHHIKTVHEHAKAYDCPCCSYRTVHLGSLKNHIMAKHTNEKGHKCPHCPYMAVQSGNLKRHLISKHPNKKAKRSS